MTIGTPVTNISAPRGIDLACRGWQQEAAYRMLQNNLDPMVAFDPDNPSVIWSGCYLKYNSIWPGYLSHLFADVAIMAIGWRILFA